MTGQSTCACRIALAALTLAAWLATTAPAMAQPKPEPKFEGLPIKVEFTEDGRNMRLMSPVAFVGPNGRRWDAPSGMLTDGASIPRFAWTLIGGPFEGKYRNAAIIHDRYCDTRTRTWQDTHEVFFHAMVASGVSNSQAKIMYTAVYRFGPRWPDPKPNPMCIGPDGKVDYSKCTENSAFLPSERYFPAATASELDKFLDDMEKEADPADVAKLRAGLK